METLTSCPRGHALVDDAVYCTVCWIRVAPDERPIGNGRRKRRQTIALAVLFEASCLAVGVSIAAIIASSSAEIATPIAAGPTASAQTRTAPNNGEASTPASQPSVAENNDNGLSTDQSAALVGAPLAATVPQPVDDPAAADCVMAVRGDRVACAVTDDTLEFTVCVPRATTLIRVGTRPDDTVKFQDASSEVALFSGASSCTAKEISARVRVDSYSPAATWRIVGRNVEDKKIWKSRVETTSP